MKYDIENRVKDNSIVNLTDYLNVIDIYEDGDTETALELAIGLMTLGFGGEFEADSREVRRLLRNREYTASISNKNYQNKVAATKENQIAKLQLEEIAEMIRNGATQQIIADSLNVSLDTIKYRVRVMKEKYPDIYEKCKKCKKVGVSVHDKDDENDNEKENEKENGSGNDTHHNPLSIEHLFEEIKRREAAGE